MGSKQFDSQEEAFAALKQEVIENIQEGEERQDISRNLMPYSWPRELSRLGSLHVFHQRSGKPHDGEWAVHCGLTELLRQVLRA